MIHNLNTYICIIYQIQTHMEKILIKNFKAIINTNSVEIPVKNLLLMIGDNASGKSTVATLIYFFKSLKDEIFDFVLKKAFRTDDFDNNLLFRVRKHFVTLLGATRHLGDFTIMYSFSNNNSITISKASSGNLRITYSFFAELRNLCLKVKDELNTTQSISNQVFAQSERQRLILQLYNGLNSFFGDEELLYFLPNRNIIVSLEHRLLPIYSQLENALLSGKEEEEDVSNNDLLLLRLINYLDKVLLPKYKKNGSFEQLLQSESDLSQFSEKKATMFSSILPHIEKILRGKYIFDRYGEKILYEDSNDTKYIQLINASSGQEEIIRILQDFFLVALQDKRVVRIIDEPESHLFPIRQKEFVELCAWLIHTNLQNKLILPTHSPYILTAFNNCLYAGNIAKTKPEAVETIIPRYFWLTSEQVAAFILKDGEFENLIDESSETKLIEASRIDEVSQILNNTLDQLIEIDNA